MIFQTPPAAADTPPSSAAEYSPSPVATARSVVAAATRELRILGSALREPRVVDRRMRVCPLRLFIAPVSRRDRARSSLPAAAFARAHTYTCLFEIV